MPSPKGIVILVMTSPPQPRLSFFSSRQGNHGIMGDENLLVHPVTLQAKLPSPAKMQLLKNGKVIKSTFDEILIISRMARGLSY